MPPKKMGVNSKAEAARARQSATEERDAREKEEQYWREAEGSAKSRAAKKRQEEAEKRAEAAAKKAEARQLAEQEEKDLEKISTKKPNKKVTEAELRLRKEEEQAALRKRAEEEKRKSSRIADEKEYERMVSVVNTNRDRNSILEARTVEEAIAHMTTTLANSSVPVDYYKYPDQKRLLKAAFKAFEEAELPILKEEKPGLSLTQYKDMIIIKLWKKSPEIKSTLLTR